MLVTMKLESVDTIYHDGTHNAFTDIVRWKGRYWVCFRNGGSHRSVEGRICVISSPDMKDWSSPCVPIDTAEDNRDPKLFVLKEKLFVSSMTIKRSFAIPQTCEGEILTDDFFSLISFTEDGIRWSDPCRTWEPYKGIWWTEPFGERVYGSGYQLKPVNDQGTLPRQGPQHQTYSTEFLVSDDGLEWKTLSIISREREPTDCALAFLPDKRAVAFLRHEWGENPHPEIKVAAPPYTTWETRYDFPYWTNGPCLGMVGDTLVAASRAMLDLDSTPSELICLAESGAVRGLQLMTVDIDNGRVLPELVISCPPHPKDDWPDVSYAGILDLGEGRFAMSFYEGLKKRYCDIKLAILRL